MKQGNKLKWDKIGLGEDGGGGQKIPKNVGHHLCKFQI